MKNVLNQLTTLWLFMAFCLLPLSAMAQIMIHGTVVDENNDPVIGATVRVKGRTEIATSTDI